MQNQSPGRLVQSLLTFPVIASPTQRDETPLTASGSTVDADSSAKPLPNLPPELWEMILLPLRNLWIKRFRLVHPQWASIGAPYLFHTLYLNVHPQSVAGLIQIAGSTHAGLVNSIVWSPLMMRSDCLEVDMWLSTYQNLLENVKHGQLIELHKVYRKLLKDQTRKQPEDQIRKLANALQKLVNCRELTIDDGLEGVESACCDPVLRSAVQNSSSFYRASTWVLRPQLSYILFGSIYDLIKERCTDILDVLPHCSSISTVTVACLHWLWDGIMTDLINSRDRKRQSQWRKFHSIFARVRTLRMILKRPTDCEYVPQESSEVSTEDFALFDFPELVDLIIKVVPVRSRKVPIHRPASQLCNRQTEFDESSDEEASSHSESTLSTSDVSEEQDGFVFDGFDTDDVPVAVDKSDLVEHYCEFLGNTPLTLGLVRFPKIAKITLGNVLIDTDLLLAWCWFQPCLPRSRLAITMTDIVIFDQLAVQDFMSALASLNVELIYDHRRTGYFGRSEWSYQMTLKKDRLFLSSKRFSNLDGWLNYVSKTRTLEVMPPIAKMPQFRTKEVVSVNRTDFLRGNPPRFLYPWSLQEYETSLEEFQEYILDFWEDA